MSENKEPEIRRTNRDPGPISEDDIKIAEGLEKQGLEIPESLKVAYEAHKAKNQTPAPTPDPAPDPKPEEEKDKKDETGAGDTVDPQPTEDNKDKKSKSKKSDAAKDDKDKDDKSGKEPGGEGEGEGGEGTVDLNKHPKRSTRQVPYSKLKHSREAWEKKEGELLKQLKIATDKLEEYKTAKTEKDEVKIKEILKAAAEKSGLEEDVLKSILDTIEELRVKPLASKIKVLEKAVEDATSKSEPTQEEKDKKEEEEQDDKFDKDFEAALKADDADPEMANHKEEIKKFAFMEEHIARSIWEIYTRFVKKAKSEKKAPPENPSGTGGDQPSDKNWEEIAKDPKKIAALSTDPGPKGEPSEAEQFQTHMGNKPRPIRRVI